MVIGLLVVALATVIGCGIGCSAASKKEKERQEAERHQALQQKQLLAAHKHQIKKQQALIARQRREKQELASSLARAVSYHTTAVISKEEKAKVNFFDTYRDFDVYLARIAGRKGSSGVSLLINAMRNSNGDRKMKSLVPALKAMRDYRNNLAHNHNKWKDLPNPSFPYGTTIQQVKAIVEPERTHYAKLLRRS